MSSLFQVSVLAGTEEDEEAEGDSEEEEEEEEDSEEEDSEEEAEAEEDSEEEEVRVVTAGFQRSFEV